MAVFADRTDAGRRLATVLAERGLDADVVLAVPRGGLPVGRAVADALGVPLDVVVARKVGAPGNPELAVGAVASDGTVWVNEDLVRKVGVGEAYVDEQVARERNAATAKLERYRGDRPPLDLRGETVVVVDDGLATGATMTACVRQVANAGAARVIVAVPVGSPNAVERLRAEADEVVCVETPRNFAAVGQYYGRFDQVSDEAAIAYLADGERDD